MQLCEVLRLNHISFHSLTGKGALGLTGGADVAPPNELASMSPEAMRELLMQQQSAPACLQSKIEKDEEDESTMRE